MTTKMAAVRKDRFPQLLKLLWNNVARKTVLKIFGAVLKNVSRERVFDGKQLLEIEPDINGVVSKVLLNALQEKRFGGKLRTIQRKKLNVQPGKIIVDEDDENENKEE